MDKPAMADLPVEAADLLEDIGVGVVRVRSYRRTLAAAMNWRGNLRFQRRFRQPLNFFWIAQPIQLWKE
jgi:hypothetical protein